LSWILLELNHFPFFALCVQSCWARFPNSTRRPHCGNFLFDIVRKLRSFCWVGYRWSWITSPILWPLFGEPLSEVVPGFLVIHIPIQAVCSVQVRLTFNDFSVSGGFSIVLPFCLPPLLAFYYVAIGALLMPLELLLPLELSCRWNFCWHWKPSENLLSSKSKKQVKHLKKQGQ
jgi:hypothetical protein